MRDGELFDAPRTIPALEEAVGILRDLQALDGIDSLTDCIRAERLADQALGHAERLRRTAIRGRRSLEEVRS